MRRFGTQLFYFFSDQRVRRNVRALFKYVALLFGVVAVYSVLFQAIMTYLEGKAYSWVTGFYWTLITMSTLGYGDVTFQSDVGRLFTIVVLLSGIVMMFVVLPYTFIRYFYAPWLETQLRRRTPREVPPDTRGHVILCSYDTIAPGLIARLEQEAIPYFVVEADLDVASDRYLAGISVVTGEIDDRATYQALRADQARMVFANREDTVNTNIALTVREVAPEVPVVAIANRVSAVEVLRLSGATHVLPLQRWLGEQLAHRVNASHAQSHVIGQYRDLLIAELPVHQTPLAGKTIRETRLRENTGVSIIGVWERGRLHPARPDRPLTQASVPVVIGTEAQLDELNYLLFIYDVNPNPVLVIGGGEVGVAAAQALQRKEVLVHLVEQDAARCVRLRTLCEKVFQGDAADPEMLLRAGVKAAPSVLITTSHDATNIYLASHCRRLNPELRIVSRISQERNVETIRRAGADFVLGSASLGVEATFSILKGKELVVLGEGVDLFSVTLPPALFGKTLAESAIGARTALNVIAVQYNGEVVTNPPASTRLRQGAELLVIGDAQQRRTFAEVFGAS